MKIKIALFLIVLFGFFYFNIAFADGGMVIWPRDIYLEQTAQNAIIAWNGKEEVMILSNGIQGTEESTALRMVPLPSNPEIRKGNFESFETITEIMNKKLEEVRDSFEGKQLGVVPGTNGIEITFHEQIGTHNVTVVKVSNLDIFLKWISDFSQKQGLSAKEISPVFREGISNYLKRDIKYFVFDVVNTSKNEERSIEPLVYKFESSYLYYPLLISGVSEIADSRAYINLFFIIDKDVKWPEDFAGYPVEFSQEELSRVSEDLVSIFHGSVDVSRVDFYEQLADITMDLVAFPSSWLKSSDIRFGVRSNEVKILQKLLINMQVWESSVDATGYFGSITEKALIKAQETFKHQIGLETPTGYLDSKTRDFLERTSMGVTGDDKPESDLWNRNLGIGARGDDVKHLQEMLIGLGFWESSVSATGYFGPITRSAVIRFQEEYSSIILEPLGLNKGTGFMGSSTRAYLNLLRESAYAPSEPQDEEDDYYGSSTLGPCEQDSNCFVSGCNGEICQSDSEETMNSICMMPLKPVPSRIGYACKCVEKKCSWAK